MHLEQAQFCESVKTRFPNFFTSSLVVEIGSMDINGNNRYLFPNCEYIGVDIAPGPNVDIVSKGHEYHTSRNTRFDVAISTNSLEHDIHWEKTLHHMYELLRYGGLMMITVPTIGAGEHGTRRSDAPLSPATVAQGGEWADYYRNLIEEDLRSILHPDALFESYEFSKTQLPGHDLCFWGIKKQKTDPPHTIQYAYDWCLMNARDIYEHIPILKQYASEVKHITEFGVRDVISTWAFLAGRPEKLISYDINETLHAKKCMDACDDEGLSWRFIIGDTLKISIEPTDLLFIDTWHTYDQLRQELALHADKVLKYIILHDTTAWGNTSEFIEGSTKGLWDAVEEFVASHPEWIVKRRYTNCNGLTILAKEKKVEARRVSIVIPTWNHLDDLLKPCIESIERNVTDKYDIEFIVVANGCSDATPEYLRKLWESNPSRYKFYVTPEQIGFTKASNIGFRMATAEYVLILNNDVIVLDWGRDIWMDRLLEPFDSDNKVAASGPLQLHDPYSDRDFLVGFCVMYRADLLKAFGYFDEIYAPAAGEDVDISIKFQDAGWKIANIQDVKYVGWTNTGDYPMWHINNQSYKSVENYSGGVMKTNGLHNMRKYNKHIKLNLGSGGVEFPGYLSVDLYDKRALISADITKPMPMFDNDSVDEILLSHSFEHLNPYLLSAALAEWKRILRPGGRLIIEVPNLEVLCRRFTEADRGGKYGIANCIYGSVNTTETGEPTDITAPHLFGWWPDSMTEWLSGAGYENIVFLPEQIHHPVIPEDNMRVECNKPLPKKEQEMNTSQLAVDSARMTTEEISHTEIWTLNTYGVDRKEIEGKVVIDVGAFNGDSALYFKSMGAEQVIAFEMNPDNFAKLVEAIRGKQGIQAYHAAVYNDDENFVHFKDEGGTSKVTTTGDSVQIPAISLGSILRGFTTGDDKLALKIDCEGAEFPIIMSTPVEQLRRFEYIYAEIHDEMTSGHKISELVKYLVDAGFDPYHQPQSDVFYYEKDHLGEIIFTKTIAQTYKFVRTDKPITIAVENPANPYGVTAYISTKDRYFTTLPLAIMGIANQTFKVDSLIIFDDGEQLDLRKNSLYGNIFKYLDMKNISWSVVFGERKGQVLNHQKALDMVKTEFIWRVDDDNFPEPTVLENLMRWMDDNVGAVGSIVRVPNQEIFPREKCSGDIQRCVDTPNLQWSDSNSILETDHLHNTFMYRKSAARHGYQMDLSPVGHREETLFTHGIRTNGYKLLVIGEVITWHFREATGGIRAYGNVELWEHDDKIFKEEMRKRGVLFDNNKYIVLDNGIGDHYAFKHILDELIERYGRNNIVIASCFPDALADSGVRQISIADASNLFGDITRFNIYHWMWKHQWNKSIVDAFRSLYL